MAAAIIPIVAPLIPGIIDLITGLVHQKAPAAEAARGPGTGAVKFADVFTAVMSDLAHAHAAGATQGPLPDEATVKTVIQAVVSSMKLAGMLDGSPSDPPATASSQAFTLKPGQSITITGA